MTDSAAPSTGRAWAAARDITILVAGILAAFGLEAWWAERQDIKRETEILTALAIEFSEAEVEILRIGSVHEMYGVRIGRLEDAVRRESATGRAVLLPDTLALWLFPFMTLDIPTGVLESVAASGEIGLIRDLELRASLAAWPTVVADAVEEEEVVRNLVYNQIVPQLGGLDRLISGQINAIYESASEGGPTMVAFPHDPTVLNLIAARVRLERLIVDEYALMVAKLGIIKDRLGGIQ